MAKSAMAFFWVLARRAAGWLAITQCSHSFPDAASMHLGPVHLYWLCQQLPHKVPPWVVHMDLVWKKGRYSRTSALHPGLQVNAVVPGQQLSLLFGGRVVDSHGHMWKRTPGHVDMCSVSLQTCVDVSSFCMPCCECDRSQPPPAAASGGSYSM